MTVVAENVENGLPSKKRIYIKGASEIILGTCNQFYNFSEDKILPMDEELRSHIEDEIHSMADQALRTICIAYKEYQGDEGNHFCHKIN